MKEYYGTKKIQAEPKSAPGAHGNQVDGYKVVYPDGYDSWSPKDAFEAAYRYEIFSPGASPTLNTVSKWGPSVVDIESDDWSVVD